MALYPIRPFTLFGPLPNTHAQLLHTLFHDKLIYTQSLIASQMCTGTIFNLDSDLESPIPKKACKTNPLVINSDKSMQGLKSSIDLAHPLCSNNTQEAILSTTSSA